MTTQFDKARNETKTLMEAVGLSNVSFPGIDKSGKAQVLFTHTECGTEQTWQLGNVKKRLKADPNTAPCSKCGGKRRAMIATLASAKSRSEAN